MSDAKPVDLVAIRAHAQLNAARGRQGTAEQLDAMADEIEMWRDAAQAMINRVCEGEIEYGDMLEEAARFKILLNPSLLDNARERFLETIAPDAPTKKPTREEVEAWGREFEASAQWIKIPRS